MQMRSLRTKSRWPASLRGRLLLMILVVSSVLGACSRSNTTLEPTQIKGAWVQARSITTSEQVDEILDRAQGGKLDAIFVNVLAFGHAYYDSSLLPKHPKIEPDFDPLAYLVEAAGQRGIEVHTWLVAGPMSYNGRPGQVLVDHPDWAMIGPDDQPTNWLNYSLPDVRQFISDLALEIVTSYNVDGIHFDYTRYPGAQWGFDPYSAEQLAQEYGLDLDTLRYPDLPAFAHFSGNPLIWPGKAQVLARFDNRQPAVLLNAYGAGKAIILNWDAAERTVLATDEILNRSIHYLLGADGELYLLRSETNEMRYSSDLFDIGLTWLQNLGWYPIVVEESDLAGLEPGSVLVLPQVYWIQGQFASDLASFVHRGGSVVFLDGPTPSIWNKHVRAVTGMLLRGKHFERASLLTATKEHEILPLSERTLPLDAYRATNAQWKAFRAQAISDLLQDVYHRVKQIAPDTLVTITVHPNQERLSEQYLQDWQSWLDGRYVDLIIPLAYIEPGESLAPIIRDWQPAMKQTGHFALGLSTYAENRRGKPAKTPEQVLSEIETALGRGSEGYVLFDLERTGAAVLEALSTNRSTP